MEPVEAQRLVEAAGLVRPVDDRNLGLGHGASPLPSLDGAVVGLLDNRKGNANTILERVAAGLSERFRVAGFVRVEKRIFSRPADEETLSRLVRDCQGVITAVGD